MDLTGTKAHTSLPPERHEDGDSVRTGTDIIDVISSPPLPGRDALCRSQAGTDADSVCCRSVGIAAIAG